MIFNDIYKYLSEDVILKDYLVPTENDSKIYPNFARNMSKPPYVVYRAGGAGGAEILDGVTMVFLTVAQDYFVLNSVSARISELLSNKEDISSGAFNIYFSRKTACSDFVDERGYHVRSQSFAFKFRKKQENL